MADTTDVTYYVDQKAQIGMSDRFTRGYDSEVARTEIEELIVELEEEGRPAHLRGTLRDAIDDGYIENEEQLNAFLYREAPGEDFWEVEFGRVVDPYVVIAHAALNKCAWLLRAKYGGDGPPECRQNDGT